MDGTRMCFCAVSKRQMPLEDLVPMSFLRPELFQILVATYPYIEDDGYISLDELRKIDVIALNRKIEQTGKRSGRLEQAVVQGITGPDLASLGCQEEIKSSDSLLDRLAESLARWLFNWVFLLFILLGVVAWLLVNAHLVIANPPDPPPFPLLNLIFSGLAGLFAAGLFLLQYQQTARRRKLEETQYQVNLRVELELRVLQEKVDHLSRLIAAGASPKKPAME